MNVRLSASSRVHAARDHRTVCGKPIGPEAERLDRAVNCKACLRLLRPR